MATINDFGIPGLSTGGGILAPKQKSWWRITFANLAGGSNTDNVSAQAVTVNRPQLSFDEIELNRYNSKAWVASRHTWEPVTLTIEDDVKGEASKIIQEQLQKQKFLIGAEGPFLAAAGEGSLYKFVTYLEMLDGNEQVIERWTLEGTWIQNANYGDLDYGASEAVTIELTIRFDHARQDIGGYDQGEGVATGGAGK